MAIGRTFQESLQKALRGLELGLNGFAAVSLRLEADLPVWRRRLSVPSNHRLTDLFGAFQAGITLAEINELSHIDLWFLDNLHELYEQTVKLKASGVSCAELNHHCLFKLKQLGFGDRQLAALLCRQDHEVSEQDIFARRQALAVTPVYKTIDTCAAEFPVSGRRPDADQL